jgi:hypothetical protein
MTVARLGPAYALVIVGAPGTDAAALGANGMTSAASAHAHSTKERTFGRTFKTPQLAVEGCSTAGSGGLRLLWPIWEK